MFHVKQCHPTTAVPDDQRRIRPERYQGYLRHWVYQIIELHDKGVSASEIAAELRPKVFARYHDPTYLPSSTLINYILDRVVVKRPPPRRASSLATDLTVYPWRIEWEKKEAAREARWNRIVDEWLAENQQRDYERIRRSNKGRPIDMGGPRDIWIDRDPWSDL
jgi:hypothetical protein